ncbi:uncharacterized protein LOC132281045 [Cornus florida]|uniref:uncharacterized protein LOC132281045 n=1 Tax=Cornus florida TaxID=4283 RepID=UPI00289F725E|nr:uncharacterized protein LOC132281045 [Cornus florida]
MSVNGPMFLKAVNCEGEFKDKFFISELIKETIQEVGPDDVVQVITDNTPVCRSAGLLVEVQFPKLFWTPCVVHTLNLALKNICAAKNNDANEVVFLECHWITTIIDDCMFIKNFIMNHSMRLAMFHENVKLTMLSIADTRFASMIVMLRRFKQIKCGLQEMVMSDFWTSYREDNVQRALTVKTKIVSDDWWRDIDYIINFTEPIYDMLRRADTDIPCLHLVYEMWDSMIAKVKAAIYHHERKQEHEESPFFLVVREILNARWSKSNTPLHCFTHSLNPSYHFVTSKFYSTQWLQEAPNRVPPHRDQEISSLKENCFQRYFTNDMERRKIKEEYACFSVGFREFGSVDSLNDRGLMEPAIWRTPQYNVGETKMWDVGGDAFDSLEGSGILEIANLSLDEPDLEAMIFTDEGDGNDDEFLEDLT